MQSKVRGQRKKTRKESVAKFENWFGFDVKAEKTRTVMDNMMNAETEKKTQRESNKYSRRRSASHKWNARRVYTEATIRSRHTHKHNSTENHQHHFQFT